MRCHCDTRTCWPCYRLGRTLTEEVMPMDPFTNYDAWLERPYQEAQAAGEARQDAFERFCDFNGYDPSDPVAVALFEDIGCEDEDGLDREAARFDREGWYGDEDAQPF